MSHHELKIWLVRKHNGVWAIRYIEPDTGRTRQKSTGATRKKDAERQLGELRADLLNHRYQPTSNISWSEFRRRYEEEVVTSLARKTGCKIATVFNHIEELLNPTRLRDLNAERLSHFQSKLRESGIEEVSIDGYLAHLQAALNWAVSIELLPKLPKIQRPRRAGRSNVMKGRPIDQAEFTRILDAVESVVGPKASMSWKHYLEGLWWSGLRLSESPRTLLG